jgi:kynurenine formamidase
VRQTFLSSIVALTACSLFILWARAESSSHTSLQRWTLGKGWGWVWGTDDEVGSLNEMTDNSRLAAMQLARQGQVFDLGLVYDRDSFKWPGHSPGEVITFRSPENLKRQGDFLPMANDPSGTAWHSTAIFMSDNVGTQIDGLAHAVEGDDNHWYNGFKVSDWGGNFGPRRCDASTIPPIIARGVLIDVASSQGVRALPAHYAISIQDIEDTLRKQKVSLTPGDVVLIRTGAAQFWASGDDKKRGLLTEHDSAGITLETAQWLVEQKGAMLIASDTSGLEQWPASEAAEAHQKTYGSFMPVHNYLLIKQGVHIGELHHLEGLAREKIYEFCYICTTAKIRGCTAGFALRPIAVR